MARDDQNRGDGYQSEWLANHPLLAATIVYVLLCVPAFTWLAGPVGAVGTVDRYTTAIALALGGIMIVPVIQSFIESNFAASRVPDVGGAEG